MKINKNENLNSVQTKSSSTKRDAFSQYGNENNIMTRPAWTLMNKLEMFKNYQIGDLSSARWLADRLVNIPSSVI